ncbi:hypothetical protein C8Q74DRAFT_1272502 [Fomes fomentarius]|nr:hypothetical protein C8Q74DRAFT_1272502 [Fomes fomentarius]
MHPILCSWKSGALFDSQYSWQAKLTQPHLQDVGFMKDSSRRLFNTLSDSVSTMRMQELGPMQWRVTGRIGPGHATFLRPKRAALHCANTPPPPPRHFHHGAMPLSYSPYSPLRNGFRNGKSHGKQQALLALGDWSLRRCHLCRRMALPMQSRR